MAIDIDARFRDAVQYVFTGRLRQKEKQQEAGRADAGNRGAVTGGGHMGALEILIKDILIDCGIEESEISTRSHLELPGYYRPEKKWDLVVVANKQLVMAIEFKSQVGSVGKNINNRIEEALGSPADIWTAYREGRFGTGPSPFLGYFFLLENLESLSRERVKFFEPHFEVDPAFKRASYVKRYEILFQRLVRERVYNSACFVMATADPATKITEPAEDLTFRRFVAAIRGHVVTFLGSRTGCDRRLMSGGIPAAKDRLRRGYPPNRIWSIFRKSQFNSNLPRHQSSITPVEPDRNLRETAAGIESRPRPLVIDRGGVLRYDGGPGEIEEQVNRWLADPAPAPRRCPGPAFRCWFRTRHDQGGSTGLRSGAISRAGVTDD